MVGLGQPLVVAESVAVQIYAHTVQCLGLLAAGVELSLVASGVRAGDAAVVLLQAAADDAAHPIGEGQRPIVACGLLAERGLLLMSHLLSSLADAAVPAVDHAGVDARIDMRLRMRQDLLLWVQLLFNLLRILDYI